MKKRNITKIVIHCSATRADVDYTFEQCVNDHKARGFRKCGYHYFIRKDGSIHVGRPLNEMGAHVEGHNSASAGICYEGGVKAKGNPFKAAHAEDTRTDAQKKSILKCIKEIMSYSNSVVSIVGHRDLSPDKNGNGVVESDEWIKQCPSFNATPEYSYLLK